MHCSWAASLFWHISYMGILFTSGWSGLSPPHNPTVTNHRSNYLYYILHRKAVVMRARCQSLQYQLLIVLVLAGSWLWGGVRAVSLVHWNQVLVELSCMMSDAWLGCFHAVLETLKVHQKLMALVQEGVERRTFNVYYNCLGGFYILGMVAHNLEILGLHLCWVVN